MLPYPYKTTREEKMKVIGEMKDRLLDEYGDAIVAIGVYGSIGQHTDGPYSDIELHVVTKDGVSFSGHELIYPPFKLEIGVLERSKWVAKLSRVDDGWPIWIGAFVHILPLYDPEGLFESVKQQALSVSDESIRSVMREFMVWEPYETMGKIRNCMHSGQHAYISRAASDLIWQTAKLIGLANKKYYRTRASTIEESLLMTSIPNGYKELAAKIKEGDLRNKEEIYRLCEDLWTGLNEWFGEQGIEYFSDQLPL